MLILLIISDMFQQLNKTYAPLNNASMMIQDEMAAVHFSLESYRTEKQQARQLDYRSCHDQNCRQKFMRRLLVEQATLGTQDRYCSRTVQPSSCPA